MKIATLFSGIGAPEQGAKRVYPDHKVVFACEFDKFARQSYEVNYDIEPQHFHKDVHDLYAIQYKDKVDILIGGSPCQAFSLAGLRHGTEDERGQLIYQYIRVVDECRPEVIVYENVKGIMSIDNGNTIKDFVQALRDIGYHCHYSVVNTKDYGVPQNRERLFLVGFLDHDVYHRFHFAPKVKLEKRLKDVLEDDVDEKYYLNRELLEYKSQANTVHNTDKEAPTLCVGTHGYALGYIPEPVIAASRGRNKDNPSDRTSGAEVEQRLEINRSGTSNCLTSVQKDNYVIEPKIQVPSATKQGYETATTGDSINLSVPNSKTRRGRVGKQVAQCLDTACNQAVVEERIRKLTPRECLRLQDFPDDFQQLSKGYVKSLLDTISLEQNSEVIIKDDIWEILKNITKQSVMPLDAKEDQSHSGIALCTISDSKNMVMPIMSLNTRTGQKKNANTVIALLEKVSKECAYDTITLGELTETHCGLMRSQAKKVSVEMGIGHTDTQKSKQKMGTNIDVELMLSLNLEENWCLEKLYTILISIKKMIQNQTYGCLSHNPCMVVHMELSKDVVQNCTKKDSLNLKMGNINYVSDSGMYKQAGNSMSVNILEMIFSQIEKAKVGECRNSLLDFMGETA